MFPAMCFSWFRNMFDLLEMLFLDKRIAKLKQGSSTCLSIGNVTSFKDWEL